MPEPDLIPEQTEDAENKETASMPTDIMKEELPSEPADGTEDEDQTEEVNDEENF